MCASRSVLNRPERRSESNRWDPLTGRTTGPFDVLRDKDGL